MKEKYNMQIADAIEKFGNYMVNRYHGLSIGYEYNRRRCIFLVSYDTHGMDQSCLEDFASECLSFSNLMEDRYGLDSPLFCRNESLFKLSENRITIKG